MTDGRMHWTMHWNVLQLREVGGTGVGGGVLILSP